MFLKREEADPFIMNQPHCCVCVVLLLCLCLLDFLVFIRLVDSHRKRSRALILLLALLLILLLALLLILLIIIAHQICHDISTFLCHNVCVCFELQCKGKANSWFCKAKCH